MHLASYQHYMAGLGRAKPNPTLNFNKEIKMLNEGKDIYAQIRIMLNPKITSVGNLSGK